ncbi:TPM domain-containing protein [Clostridium sp. MSJ-4]|uniref:TPM domain-containing protein n=1 Tax=Clostridium simiarum TaxID=2841506 RepID=A0ABS6EZ24_9CLOT|nr:TPM domain-containing protein [Clostridium simiarum]MBU5591370.1 TPM domain-containing protein [Clostridium simiarum]
MKKLFKRNILLSFILLLFLAISIPVSAAEKYPEPTNLKYVNDYSNVIDKDTKEFIISLGKELEDKTGAQLVVVTIDNLNGKDIRDYGYGLFSKWGIGQKSKNNGLLVLVAVKDRKYSVEVGKGLEGAVTDVGSARIMDDIAKPSFKEEKFAKGVKDVYAIFAASVAKEYDATLENNVKVPLDKIKQASDKKSSSNSSGFPGGAIAFFFILLIILGSMGGKNNRRGPGGRRGRGRYRRGIYIPPYIGSGGFGSSDNSGSSGGGIDLGGFGGGSSSGGGSSGGW